MMQQSALDRAIILAAAAAVGAPCVDAPEGIRVACRDGWHAADLLAELATRDADRTDVQRLARELRAATPRATMGNVRDFMLSHVGFEPEPGEIFVGPRALLARGKGDCDDHARMVYALLRAGGVRPRLAFLAGPDGPRHVAAQGYDPISGWTWIETTIAPPRAPAPAELGEHPFTAISRMGLSRPDAVGWEVVTLGEAAMPAEVTDNDLRKLAAVARSVGANPADLLLVLISESGLDPAAGAGRGERGAHGINQILGMYLPKFGWSGTIADFDAASIEAQLDVVQRFLGTARGQFGNATALYLYNFLPAYIAHANQPGFVLTRRAEGTGYYEGNTGFDVDGKGYITVQDITTHINKVRNLKRYRDLHARLSTLGEASSSGPGIALAIGAALVAGAVAWAID